MKFFCIYLFPAIAGIEKLWYCVTHADLGGSVCLITLAHKVPFWGVILPLTN